MICLAHDDPGPELGNMRNQIIFDLIVFVPESPVSILTSVKHIKPSKEFLEPLENIETVGGNVLLWR